MSEFTPITDQEFDPGYAVAVSRHVEVSSIFNDQENFIDHESNRLQRVFGLGEIESRQAASNLFIATLHHKHSNRDSLKLL